jgi:hypothetical protein
MTKVIDFKTKQANLNKCIDITYKKVSYVEFAAFIQDLLEKDMIEDTTVEGHAQFNAEGACPTKYDNSRFYISWFGDHPKNVKEICKVAYLETISETEMRCMIINLDEPEIK